MATQVPKTVPADCLLRAATKLEKSIYRKSNHKYREKIKALNEELDRYKLQCEIMIPSLQVEVHRLKEELVIKNKRCIDLEMSHGVYLKKTDIDNEWIKYDEWIDKYDQYLNKEDSKNSDDDENISFEEETVKENSDDVKNSNKKGKSKKRKATEPINAGKNENPEVTEPINASKNENTEVTESINTGKNENTEVTESKNVKINIAEITKIKTPNDLLSTVPSPISTNPEPQAQQPPGSPKKRTRSSPPPMNNFAPDRSPLNIPAMTKTQLGLGQGVKRKRRKK